MTMIALALVLALACGVMASLLVMGLLSLLARVSVRSVVAESSNNGRGSPADHPGETSLPLSTTSLARSVRLRPLR